MTKKMPVEKLKYKKIPYNQLTEKQKTLIVDVYYREKDMKFSKISDFLQISMRAIQRVLKEKKIETLRKNRYTLNEDYFSVIDTEQKAYFLGLIYADGYVGDENFNNIVISLSGEDGYMVQEFANAINFTGSLRIDKQGGGYKNAKPKTVLNFSSEKMSSDLRKIGLYPNKSTTLDFLPEIDEELYRHFIRGYFDGDGGITSSTSTSYHQTKEGKKVYKNLGYKMDIIGTKEFVKKLREKMPIKHCRYTQSNSDNMYYLSLSSREDLPVIFDYFYKDATVYFKRKFNKMSKILGDIGR